MQLTRNFRNVRFAQQTIRNAIQALSEFSSEPTAPDFTFTSVYNAGEDWLFDNVEDFFDLYRTAEVAALVYMFKLPEASTKCKLELRLFSWGTTVSIASTQKSDIMLVMNIFEESKGNAERINTDEVQEAEEEEEEEEEEELDELSPLIFIGHGRSHAWEELKNHLQDKHGLKVEAFESGVRAGHAIRDILEEMLDNSSLAFLVLTGEDETADGDVRARQNVIHETGLFQGRLGFSRAIVLLEEGVEGFSNMHGIQYISFAKGNIRSTFGDVLAVIKREAQQGEED